MPSPELEHIGLLWRRERLTVRERFAVRRRDMSLAERVARGLALVDLQVVEVEPAPGGRLLLAQEACRVPDRAVRAWEALAGAEPVAS